MAGADLLLNYTLVEKNVGVDERNNEIPPERAVHYFSEVAYR